MEQYWKISFIKLIVLLGCLNCASSVQLRCYKGSLDEYIEVCLDEDADPKKILDSDCYYPDRETLIYAPGYSQKVTDHSVQLILQAYLDGKKTNVIALDWSDVVFFPLDESAIPKAAKEIKSVAKNLGQYIVKLTQCGFCLDNLHLMGYCTGAHCMGLAGQEVQDCINQSVPRITGLDPGGPRTVKTMNFVPALNASNAKFVDAYHTNARIQGYYDATVNIWINFKHALQPGCAEAKIKKIGFFPPEYICSHSLVTKFYADAVRQCSDFVATLAPDCECSSTVKTIYLGDNIDQCATGNYYIDIDSNTPEYQTTAASDENLELQKRQIELMSTSKIANILDLKKTLNPIL